MSILFTQLEWKTRFKMWLLTLFYNCHASLDYSVDVLIEPLISWIEFYTRLAGYFLVSGVLGIISLVVFTVHTVGFTFWWNRSPLITCVLSGIGYWLLINITFNFFRAVTVPPGEPNNAEEMKTLESTVCKRCISPRPMRAHHCSVCKTCHLKMDHYCPWLNNCVGHGNHRYFYLTAAYSVVGCSFVIFFGAEIAFRCFFGNKDVLKFESVGRNELYSFIYADEYKNFWSNAAEASTNVTAAIYSESYRNSQQLVHSSSDATGVIFVSTAGILFRAGGLNSALATTETVFGFKFSQYTVRILVFITALLCICASVLMGGLCFWHGRLISIGETSIEHLVNARRRQKFGAIFVNAYDAGMWNNWMIFLGLQQPNRSFWRHVLLPSTHPPSGNGYDWRFIISRRVDVEILDRIDQSS